MQAIIFFTSVTYLKVEIQAVLECEPLGEALVLLHVVGEGVVPVGSLPLAQKHGIVEAAKNNHIQDEGNFPLLENKIPTGFFAYLRNSSPAILLM